MDYRYLLSFYMFGWMLLLWSIAEKVVGNKRNAITLFLISIALSGFLYLYYAFTLIKHNIDNEDSQKWITINDFVLPVLVLGKAAHFLLKS
jgi:hypothetical protein